MRLLAFIGVLAIAVAIVSAVYVFGGVYSVSAVEPDNGIVTWALTRVREASIARRAPTTVPINAGDPQILQAGAQAFAARGCPTCHGAPGGDWAKFAEGLRPDAADLSEVANSLSVGQIFWVVKNGINMTGMPSFQRADVGDDEIWKIAAFVKKFPTTSPEDYKKWTGTNP